LSFKIYDFRILKASAFISEVLFFGLKSLWLSQGRQLQSMNDKWVTQTARFGYIPD